MSTEGWVEDENTESEHEKNKKLCKEKREKAFVTDEENKNMDCEQKKCYKDCPFKIL